LYGRILDAPIVNPSDRSAAVERTNDLWSTLYVGEPYNIEFGQTDKKPAQEEENYSGISSSPKQPGIPPDSKRITYDLEAAVFRQKSFFYQVRFLECELHLIHL
jgi:hypothetical protein